MKKTNSLSGLLMEELADLLNAENQLIRALPKMAQASELSALRHTFEDHLEVAKGQANRIQDIFNNITHHPQEKICKAVKGFITEFEYSVNGTGKGPARDIAIIEAAQRIEQYEISEYKAAFQHAEELGHSRIMELLNESLDEERSISAHLNEMSQEMINHEALDPSGSLKPGRGGFYIPKGKPGRGGPRKKSKDTDVSRFISEGNPHIQDQNFQNPEDRVDPS